VPGRLRCGNGEYGDTVGRYFAKPSMSRPPKYLGVPFLNAGKLSPPSARKLFVTMRYTVASFGTAAPLMVRPLMTRSRPAPVTV